ncbi:MAG: hypothetical protein LBK52_01015, partial [Deltaproteobacteria bacterium]|nr:hypothetical protein [Deltaproteobacteria bacterium]
MIASSVKNRFAVLSAVLLTAILILGAAAFFLSMREIGLQGLKHQLTVNAEKMRLRLLAEVSRELNLVVKAAASPAVKQYFQRPDDAGLEKAALEEFRTFRLSLSGGSLFWISDADKIFHADEIRFFKLDPSLLENYWYNMTLYNTKLYNVNINYNKDLGLIRLWINAPVRSAKYGGERHPIGMLGTGLDLVSLLGSLYESSSHISLLMFNSRGEITAARDNSLVYDKVLLPQHLGPIGDRLVMAARNLASDEVQILMFDGVMYGLAGIGELNWYLVTSLPVKVPAVFDPLIAGLFVSILLLLAGSVYFFNSSVARMQGILDTQGRGLVALNQRLTEAAAVKSDFLARISHELRTPMNTILGMSELAKREPCTPKAMEYIEGIKQSGRTLLEIITDILDFSKIDAGTIRLHPCPYETGSLLRDVLAEIRSRLLESGVRLIEEIDPDLPRTLIGDPVRVRQILRCLLDNAAKFTKAGFVRLTAGSLPQTEESVLLTLKIEDSGQGIKTEDMGRLFEEFTRLDEKQNCRHRGTGLGLAISRSLCQLMGGSLSAQSQYGRGSVFTARIFQQVAAWEPLGAW